MLPTAEPGGGGLALRQAVLLALLAQRSRSPRHVKNVYKYRKRVLLPKMQAKRHLVAGILAADADDLSVVREARLFEVDL